MDTRLTERQASAAALTLAAVPMWGKATLRCPSCRRMMATPYEGADVCVRCIEASFAESG